MQVRVIGRVKVVKIQDWVQFWLNSGSLPMYNLQAGPKLEPIVGLKNPFELRPLWFELAIAALTGCTVVN